MEPGNHRRAFAGRPCAFRKATLLLLACWCFTQQNYAAPARQFYVQSLARRVASALRAETDARNIPDSHDQPRTSRIVSTSPGPSISLNVDRYNQSHSGEWFTVRWSGVSDPRYDDCVALVVPADADLSYSAPAKWKYAAGDVRHVDTGSGELRFRLVSYRYDVAFAFLRNGFDSPVEVARTPPIKLLHPNSPQQVHLALTTKDREMMVSWNTRDPGARPQVAWRRESSQRADQQEGRGGMVDAPSPYTHSRNATTTTYTHEEMCGGPAAGAGWLAPGSLHTALMYDLEPGVRYFYRVGDQAADTWSPEFSFLGPPNGDPGTTVRVYALADMGAGEEDGSLEGRQWDASRNTTRLVEQELQQHPGHSMLIHSGDVACAKGYMAVWDNFLHQIEPIASTIPYMTAAGNHERDWPGTGDLFGVEDSGGECGVPYERRMPMPYPGPDKDWYSMEFGPIFLLVYSTEVGFGAGTEQYYYVANTLPRVDRRRTPWLLVSGHRPPYVASTKEAWPDGDLPVAQMIRDAYEDMWKQYNVDLTLHGHHHSYQRSCPVYKQECMGYDEQGVARAPVHVIAGNGGAGLAYNIQEPPPDWLQALKLWWGYVRLEANATCLTLESVSDEDGRVVDSLVLRKPKGWGERYMRDKAGCW